MPHTSSENETGKRRVLNLRAVAVLAGTVTLACLLTTWLHASQVVRTAGYLKSEARQALAEDEHERALELFEQYLTLSPEDAEVSEQVALLLEEQDRKSVV